MAKMSERKEAFFRIIVAIVSGIIIAVWNILIRFLILFNFVYTIFKNKRHRGMAELAEWWNTEAYKLMRYITFVSNIRPFPFTDAERMTKFR